LKEQEHLAMLALNLVQVLEERAVQAVAVVEEVATVQQ
jgi:hypothetical protein